MRLHKITWKIPRNDPRRATAFIRLTERQRLTVQLLPSNTWVLT